MQRDKEIALLEELLGLKDNGMFYLDPEVTASPIERYASPDRFSEEMRRLFRAVPLIAAHACELPENGSFITRDLSGLPVLVTRDKEGGVHAFLNVCRHRGARLVNDASGCKNAFSCPYHAWTWSNSGVLRGVPHQDPGFPGLDRSAHGLVRLPASEKYGLIWVIPDPKSSLDIDAFIAPLESDFAWLEMDRLEIVHSTVIERQANWKLLVEGGIEAYHFKVTHKDTIGPHFLDNLSSYEMLGCHMRSVLPRSSLSELSDVPKEKWSIRDAANVLFMAFPANQFLAMQDHIAWIGLEPLAHDRSRIRLTTLAPAETNTPEMEKHWERNHQITSVTLDEDFEVNEAVQSGVATGANRTHTFGRYEGALNQFNLEVEKYLV